MRGRLRIALLVAALVPLAGSKCGGGPASVQLRFEPATAVVTAGGFVELDLVADLGSRSLQAFDVDVAASSPVLAAYAAEPHPAFDDDGALFVEPQLAVGTGGLRRVVDLRHGAAAATGTVVLARVRVLALAPGAGTVSLSRAGLSTPTGGALGASVTPATVTVQSP